MVGAPSACHAPCSKHPDWTILRKESVFFPIAVKKVPLCLALKQIKHEYIEMKKADLSGIAALAASGKTLRKKRRVEYRSLPSKSILNRCANPRMPFRWTINPYRGCEIGCHYCYAAYTHKYLGIEDPSRFDSLIFSKERAKRLLRRELEKKVEGPIAIGTGTDPYQPAERRFETTRGILEVFSRGSGHTIGITTKSDLILRDIDLLGTIAARNNLHVSLTVTTMDEALARLLEPRSVRPDKRIDAVRQLRWRGLQAGVFSAPVLPLLTDSAEILGCVAEAAKRADASYWRANPLFITSATRERMMPFLEAQFPHLAARYKAHYRRGAYVSPGYRDWLDVKVERIRRKHGLAGQIHVGSAASNAPAGPMPPVQQSLFSDGCA